MPPSHDRSAVLNLSRVEAWVVHAALLARIESRTDADQDVDQECTLLRKIETDDYGFDTAELELLQQALTGYLSDAPSRDRDPAQTVLKRVRGVLA